MVNVVRKVVVLFLFVCGFGARDEHAGRLATYGMKEVSTTSSYLLTFRRNTSFRKRGHFTPQSGFERYTSSPILHTMEKQNKNKPIISTFNH